ncbi:hypothetical protein DYB28_005331 [Aphanomyces astaci]|uniref:50S ribosomal protein L35 n=3 Tax=Aphanomyces astaci TaxID=112090 RepID=A0A397AVS9_APHAT|nr:hypothetical protein DYB36_013802 [Aphanomyces astaci]RLO05344.1 hypothetical protein DYB28_005331 [Aphanomyces astaci]
MLTDACVCSAAFACTTGLLSRGSPFAFAHPPAMMSMQVRDMGYKLKTKSAVKKRFFVNANGHIKRGQAGKRHLATDKSRQRIRRLGKAATVTGQIRKNILAMLRR